MDCNKSYKDAVEYLFSRLPMFSRVGAAAYKPGLERSEALARHFGNPQQKLKCIHVAGTNGKGSVSNMIAAVLQSMGYRTALYTSPHLTDFRERMRIDGKMIPQERVVRFVDEWKNGSYSGDAPSFFELTMMLAFCWFAESDVDFAVIEVGMGGRLDSTNIIEPILSVITNISFDHRQFLGDTLAKIASEKAGIMKPGVPCVIGEARGEVLEVFSAKARQTGTPLILAEDSDEIVATRHSPIDGWYITTRKFGEFDCRLPGEYQLPNIRTALCALSVLRHKEIEITDCAVKHAMSHIAQLTGFRGRWSVLKRTPLIICDTGHNEAGLNYNMRQLTGLAEQLNEADTLRIVIGFVADKEVEHIVPMLPRNARYYVCAADIPRAMAAPKLASLLTDAGFANLETYASVGSAYDAAVAEAAQHDIIFIGGSTFVVADMLRRYDEDKGEDNE